MRGQRLGGGCACWAPNATSGASWTLKGFLLEPRCFSSCHAPGDALRLKASARGLPASSLGSVRPSAILLGAETSTHRRPSCLHLAVACNMGRRPSATFGPGAGLRRAFGKLLGNTQRLMTAWAPKNLGQEEPSVSHHAVAAVANNPHTPVPHTNGPSSGFIIPPSQHGLATPITHRMPLRRDSTNPKLVIQGASPCKT